MSNTLLQKYTQRFEEIKSGRGDIEGIWEEITKAMNASKEGFSYATLRRSRNQLASHLQNFIITPHSPWFGISLVTGVDSYNKRQEEEWSQDIEEVLLDVFNNPQSNFISAIRQFFLSLCAYGSQC